MSEQDDRNEPESAVEEVLREVEEAERREQESTGTRGERGEAGDAITPNTEAQEESTGE